MRPSHCCPGCGADLARTPTTREPHYGLSVAVCPRCGRVTARRRMSLERRQRRKLVHSIRTLISQVLLAMLILLSVGGLTWMIADMLEERAAVGAFSLAPRAAEGRGFLPARLLTDIHPVGLITWVIALTCAGVWLAAAQRHVRPWIAWPVMLGAAMAIMWFGDAASVIASMVENTGVSRRSSAPSDGVRLQILMVGAMVMGIGGAFGYLSVKVSDSSRPSRLRALRRKIRRRRSCA